MITISLTWKEAAYLTRLLDREASKERRASGRIVSEAYACASAISVALHKSMVDNVKV